MKPAWLFSGAWTQTFRNTSLVGVTKIELAAAAAAAIFRAQEQTCVQTSVLLRHRQLVLMKLPATQNHTT